MDLDGRSIACQCSNGPHFDAIARALQGLLESRRAARQRKRLAVNAAQARLIEQLRHAERVYIGAMTEAARIRREAIEASADGSDAVVKADVRYFAMIKAAEEIHSEKRKDLAAAKGAAETSAREARDQDYRAAESWFLAAVRLEIGDAIRGALVTMKEC